MPVCKGRNSFLQTLTYIFDCIDLVADRLHRLNRLLVEAVLLALAAAGADALFIHHP